MPTTFTRRRLVKSLAMFAMLGSPLLAQAQSGSFPNRPVKIIVTSAVGGSADVMARLIAEKLSVQLGQSVVVEQKTGANGMVGTVAALAAPPDGYTVFMSFTSLVQNLHVLQNPGYKLEDFAPVSMVASLPLVLASSSSLPATSVSELMKLAVAEDGKLSFGSSGVGSSGHLMGATLARLAGAKVVHVPYKGESASFTDLASGRLAAHFGSIGFYAPQAAAGKVRILAVASQQRLKRHPAIPTLAEAGFGPANLAGWAAMFVPAATPAPVVQKLSEGFQKVLAQPDVQNAILDLGFEPGGSTPEQLARHVQLEMSRWGAVIKDPAIKIDK